jgi:hypothetical protein
MAECAMRHDEALIVGLNVTEMETLRLHASRNGLSVTDAFADLVERGIMSATAEIIREEDEALGKPCTIPDMVGFTINWASSGPYACLNDDDTRFVEAVMAMSLREALTVVLYKKSQKGIHNVMEREDEGNGSSEHPFPVH